METSALAGEMPLRADDHATFVVSSGAICHDDRVILEGVPLTGGEVDSNNLNGCGGTVVFKNVAGAEDVLPANAHRSFVEHLLIRRAHFP